MHSPIGGSAANIFVHCAAYVTMTQAAPPQEENQDARDGTASHEIGADLVQAAAVGRSPGWDQYEGKRAKDGTDYTKEMFDGAEMYAADVAEIMRHTGVLGGDRLRVEQLLPVPRIHPAAFCTPDAALFSRIDSRLYVWEYKYGHTFVDVFENWQLVYAAAGLLEHYKLIDSDITLDLRVVQPRSYDREGPIRKWVVNAAEIRGMVNRLEAAAAAQFEPDPKATTGEHCKHCPGRLVCPAAIRAGLGLYETGTAALPAEMDAAALGLQLSIVRRALRQLESLDTAYTEQVNVLVKSGENVPGWTTEQASGREVWDCAIENAVAVGLAYGVDISKPGVMTPKQAIAAGLPEAVVKLLVKTPKRGHRVVPATDADVRKIFNHQQE